MFTDYRPSVLYLGDPVNQVLDMATRDMLGGATCGREYTISFIRVASVADMLGNLIYLGFARIIGKVRDDTTENSPYSRLAARGNAGSYIFGRVEPGVGIEFYRGGRLLP